MTELTIRPEEIKEALQKFVSDYQPEEASREEVGTVAEAGDGIARVEGLPSAMANELLEFEDGTLGLALNLDTREIGVVILGDFDKIEEGQTVRRTGDVLSVPVGDGYLGRVVDPLGNAIDGLGDLETDSRRALELQAPSVVQRKSVHEPLATGIKAIDAMTPIGRGQRQLIIGDRQTGKSTVALDTIINQKQYWETGDPSKQVRCIYVAIGQKGSTIAAARGALEEAGALEYTTIVAAPASDSAGFKYLAPVHRLGHRPALDVRRQARADHLRRPVEAGRCLPCGVAAAAPASGPRGVPRRRVLRAQPAARALREAVRRPGRRLDDRAADHRDQGQRRVGLHPDERHLDHRRSDLPPVRPVQLQPEARDRRRRLGVASRRRGDDQGDEAGHRFAEGRPRAVPRDGGVRDVRLGPRRRVPAAARPRPAADGAAQAARLLAVPGRGDGGLVVDRHLRQARRRPDRRRAALRERVPRLPAPSGVRDPRRHPRVAELGRRHRLLLSRRPSTTSPTSSRPPRAARSRPARRSTRRSATKRSSRSRSSSRSAAESWPYPFASTARASEPSSRRRRSRAPWSSSLRRASSRRSSGRRPRRRTPAS